MTRQLASCFLFFIVPIPAALAVDPNPLESAYWRFEEGTALNQVTPRNADVVLDSINDNHLRAFMDDVNDAAPTYFTTVPPTPLKSGLPNTLALDFLPNDDLYALEQNINNGIVAPGGGFTVEAAFNPNSVTAFQVVVGKDGRPGLGKLDGDFIENLQTFAMKLRADNQLLQVEHWDGAGNLVQVSTLAALDMTQWYYAAAVNDGTELSLYLDSNDGSGYQLQGSIAVTGGAIFQGDDPNNPSWDHAWTIGRGQFGGGPADFFDGLIDEVRLSNTALSPSQFLFAPPGPPGDDFEGDYNNDGIVNAADYTVWRDSLGSTTQLDADGSGNEVIDQADYTVWVNNFGAAAGSGTGATAVPEPTGLALAALALGLGGWLRRSRDGDTQQFVDRYP